MASNIVFTAEKTEISEQQSFSIRRTGWDTWDATLPWDSLSDCIMTITAAFSTPAGQTARGTLYQVHNNSGNYRPMSQLQWLDTTGSEYILSVHTDELVVLASVLTDLAEFEGVALDLDMSEMEWRHFEANVQKVLGEEGLNGLEPRVTSLEGAVTSLDARTGFLEAGAVDLDARVDSLEDLTNTGRLSDASLTTKVNNIFATKGMPLNVKDFGAVGDGIASDNAAIKAAILAAPDGGAVLIPPGTYRTTGQIDNTVISGVYKAINILAEGATFIKEHNGPTVVLRSYFETVYNVTSLTTGRIDENDHNSIVDTTILTLAAGPAPTTWKRGDLVKVVADDGVPYAENSASPTINKNRVGQHLTVVSVVGNVVTLAGALVDPYTTNIRVAKMRPVRSSWTGGIFDVSDAHIAAGYEVNTINLDGAYLPIIQNVVVQRSTATVVSLIGCFGTSLDNITAGWAHNWPNGGHTGYGYGIAETASQGTRITNCYFSQVRHAYTSGSADRPANDSLNWYGRPYQTTIANSIADSCTSSGWDTHEGGMDIKFDNVTAANCTFGFGNRSVNVTMVNVTTRDCDIGIRQFDVGGNSRVFGLVVDGWTSINDMQAFEAYQGDRVGSDMYHVVDTEMNYIRNANLRVKRRGFALMWSRWTLSDINIAFSETDTFWSNDFTAAHLVVNNMTLDYRGVTSGIVPAAFKFEPATEASSVLNLDGLLVKGTVGARVTDLFSHPTNLSASIRNVILDELPAGVVNGAFTVASFIDWECRNGTLGNSGLYQIGDTGALPLTSHRDVVTYLFTLTTNRTYSAFGNPGRIGQSAIIVNNSTSAGSLTLVNSATVQLIGGVNKVMAAGTAARFVTLPGNIWKEI